MWLNAGSLSSFGIVHKWIWWQNIMSMVLPVNVSGRIFHQCNAARTSHDLQARSWAMLFSLSWNKPRWLRSPSAAILPKGRQCARLRRHWVGGALPLSPPTPRRSPRVGGALPLTPPPKPGICSATTSKQEATRESIKFGAQTGRSITRLPCERVDSHAKGTNQPCGCFNGLWL